MSFFKSNKFINVLCPIIIAVLFSIGGFFGNGLSMFIRNIGYFFENLFDLKILSAIYNLFFITYGFILFFAPQAIALMFLIPAFKKMRKLLVPLSLAALGVFCFLDYINGTIITLSYGAGFVYFLYGLLATLPGILSAIALALLCYVLTFNKSTKLAELARNFWFAPAALYVLSVTFGIFFAIVGGYYFSFSDFFLVDSAFIIAYAGLAYLYSVSADPVTEAPVFTEPVAPVITVDPVEPVVEDTPAPAEQNNFDAADAIRNFKQLLDDGIITEEEFEAKKKQLLGL